MFYRAIATLVFSWPVLLLATPVSFPQFELIDGQVALWAVPGEEAVSVLPSADFQIDGKLPSLSEQEARHPGSWRGVLSVDVFGTADGGEGIIELSIIDALSGKMVASTKQTSEGRAPRAEVSMIASSSHSGSPARNAFDGDEKTTWHSNYGGDGELPPHWIGLVFGEARELASLTYQARTDRSVNGSAKGYRLEVLHPGGAEWEAVAEGEIPRKDASAPFVLSLEDPIRVEGFRFVIESDHSGGGFACAAEIKIPGLTIREEAEVHARQRAYLEIPPAALELAMQERLILRVRHQSGSPVVIGQARLARLHEKPTGALFGRSNGGLGPDKLGAGLLGFTGLAEHDQRVLSVMEVRENGAAAAAGLRVGDVIVEVDGFPLARNDVAPGWDWFYHSHEARLGRATEDAIRRGEGNLPIGVLRENGVVRLELPLRRQRAFSSMIIGEDPEADILAADLVGYIARNQKADGTWSSKPIVTTFAALALMATGDEKYLGEVQGAVEWAMREFSEPAKFGNLGFWNAGYVGKLYAEWHLATGDTRVLSHIQAIQDWAHAGQHPSSWEVPALGHGTNGLPYGQKALVAPACHLLIAEALAKRAGQPSKLWELLTPYMSMSWSDPTEGGNGTLGYNPSHKDLHEFWARTGMFAMVCHLREERSEMKDAMVAVMKERHPWFRNSHAYGEPGGALGLLALNLVDEEAYREVIAEYAWWFSLAWEPGYGLRFTTPHMGAPYMGEDDLLSAAYALVLQGSRKNIQLTGSTKVGSWETPFKAQLSE